MGSDLTVVNSAKVSFAKRADEYGDGEAALLRFLIRERHGSPFESVTMRWVVRAPLYVLYEWHRHRVGHSVNEESARYTKMRDDYIMFGPDEIREQYGRPGNYKFRQMEDKDVAINAADLIVNSQAFSFGAYKQLLDMGVAKEQARVVLPTGMFKEQVWTCNLRSLMHFLGLRMDANAQREIRMYAHAAYRIAHVVAPDTMAAFAENGWVSP